MVFTDMELENFVQYGAKPLPKANKQGFVENNGAKIWYSTYGSGHPVVLLHGGFGNSGNWGYQIPDLIKADLSVILIDSRGHGRSTRDTQRYTYELMASDVLAVLDFLQISKIGAIGWSDGAIISMILGLQVPDRIAGVFFFGCNMDPSGTKEMGDPPLAVQRCSKRHFLDYKTLSSTPDEFDEFASNVSEMMKTEPNYTAEQLKTIRVPVLIVQSEFDEFIKREHAEYLAKSIPTAKLLIIPGVSHFAPLQQPALFNKYLLEFIAKMKF